MAARVERARRFFTVEMTPIGGPPAASVTSLTRLLVLALGARAVALAQNPVRLPPRRKPQPDLALLRPPSGFSAGPAAEDVLLVIEVADPSLGYDRTVKQRLFARAGAPETWIVDTGGQAVEVRHGPTPEGYRESRRVPRDGTVRPLAFPDIAIAVA